LLLQYPIRKTEERRKSKGKGRPSLKGTINWQETKLSAREERHCLKRTRWMDHRNQRQGAYGVKKGGVVVAGRKGLAAVQKGKKTAWKRKKFAFKAARAGKGGNPAVFKKKKVAHSMKEKGRGEERRIGGTAAIINEITRGGKKRMASV